MKIEEMNIYDMPIWMCAVIDEISETCLFLHSLTEIRLKNR